MVSNIQKLKNCKRISIFLSSLPDSSNPKPDCIVKIMKVAMMTHMASIASLPGSPPKGLEATVPFILVLSFVVAVAVVADVVVVDIEVDINDKLQIFFEICVRSLLCNERFYILQLEIILLAFLSVLFSICLWYLYDVVVRA